MGGRYVSVKRIRERMGLDQETFAARFPVDVRTIQRWEADSVRPSPMALARLKQMAKDAGEPIQSAFGQIDKAIEEAGSGERSVAKQSQSQSRPSKRKVNGEAPSERFSFLGFTPPRE